MKILYTLGLLLLLSTQANAAIISGWSTYSYALSGPGISDGGLGATSSATDNISTNGRAYSSATLAGLNNTPVLKAYSQSAESVSSPAENRAYAETFGVQGFTYDGSTSTTLTLDLLLDAIYTPGAHPPPPGSSIVAEAKVALIRSSVLDFYPHYPTLVYEIAPVGSLVDDASMAMRNDGVILSTKNSVSITVNPGDDFFVVAYLKTDARFGETVDAAHTFTMEFTDNTNLTAASISAVPVPAAVWLFASGLICLFGTAKRKINYQS